MNTNTSSADRLRGWARHMRAAGMTTSGTRESMIEDYPDLPRGEAERIVDQEWAAPPPAAPAAPPPAAPAAAAAAAEAPAGRPVLSLTDDGLAEALRLAGWRVRWNPQARHVEAAREGGEDWTEAAGLTRDIFMNDCSKVAMMRRGARDEPWRTNSRGLEDRLLAVVAARNVAKDAEGSPVYETVAAWARAQREPRPMTITEVLVETKVLQRYEAAARAPKAIFADAAAALTAAGWARRSVRTPNGPRKLWCPPRQSGQVDRA